MFRVESCLQAIERQRNIRKRWGQSDEVFLSTLGKLDEDVRADLLQRARTEARERATLLQLKRKYPGR